jgi:hypothetical protein
MLLYKHIDLIAWGSIVERFHKLMPDVVKQQSYTCTQEDKIWLAGMIEPAVESTLGRRLKIKSAIVFGQGSGSIQEIHVDGFGINRKGASNWALNIPIANCEHGEMIWYSGKFHLSETANTQGLKYLELNWDEEQQIQESIVVDRPTIVKIDIPHQVINRSDKRRLMLSVRFTPDISIG